MDDSAKMTDVSMAALPPPLARRFLAAVGTGGKRERTQALLVHAAVQVFAARGVAGATLQEVAQVAGVTAGTVYNHFASKEELTSRVAYTVAEGLCLAINDSYAHVRDATQRMAIGQRRYVQLAAQSPGWALMMLDVVQASPGVADGLHRYPLADLRLGIRQKVFHVPSEAAAMDAILGVVTSAMRRAAHGLAPRHHDVAAACVVLRGLGVPDDVAAEVAQRPLPPLVDPPQEAPTPARARAAQPRSGPKPR